jgi:hypothetical protein
MHFDISGGEPFKPILISFRIYYAINFMSHFQRILNLAFKDNMFLRNVENESPNDTATYPRTHKSWKYDFFWKWLYVSNINNIHTDSFYCNNI